MSDSPIPFTKKQLQQDIVDVFLFKLRTNLLIAEPERLWQLTGLPRPGDGVEWWGLDADVLGLTYSHVASTALAKLLDQEYDYAFLGIERVKGGPPMNYESDHMWLADLLMDLSNSQMLEQWASYGDFFHESIARCLHTCELANARIVLEKGECFSYFSAGTPGKDRGEPRTANDALTIRQMALLSGMEDMSIRTAASRPGPNFLETYKDGRRTLISRGVAKNWLIAKGRYVEPKLEFGGGELDLKALPIRQLGDLSRALFDRCRQLGIEKTDSALAPLVKAFRKRGYDDLTFFEPNVLVDQTLMRSVAKVLQLPEDLLLLRANEAVLLDQIQAIQSAVHAYGGVGVADEGGRG